MRFKWLAFFQALFGLGFLAVGIPALVDWSVFNGLDVLAIVLFIIFLITCYVEPSRK